MLARDKSLGLIVVLTILLLLNLSFSLFSANLSNFQNSDNTVGLSGPIVSFAQSIEIVIVATLKRATKQLRLRLARHKNRKDFSLSLRSLNLVYIINPHTAIFKTVQNLKLEGG